MKIEEGFKRSLLKIWPYYFVVVTYFERIAFLNLATLVKIGKEISLQSFARSITNSTLASI